MSVMTAPAEQLCPHPRCAAMVALVRLVRRTGPPTDMFIDPYGIAWQSGGRVILHSHQPDPEKGLLGTLLSQASIHKAFGVTLYRPHADTCAGGSGKKVVEKVRDAA